MTSAESAIRQLREACKAASRAMEKAGFGPGRVAQAVNLSRPVVSRLTSDGDKEGWRTPSMPTCRAIDGFCNTRLHRNFRLVELRTAYDAAGGGKGSGRDLDPTVLSSYLRGLAEVLTRAPEWTPFVTLGDGFQSRQVQVSSSLRPARDGSSWQAVVRGDVPWDAALLETNIAVVLGDAGYGKSWQSRRHAARIADEALAAGDTPVPLWLHAADLAKAWGHEPAREAMATAALRVLARAGIDTSAMHSSLLRHLEGDRGTVVVVDAYDEVIDASARIAARTGIAHLVAWVREQPGRQLLLMSRDSGYDGVVQPSTDPAAEDVVFVKLGGLDEAQIRAMWRAWFVRRGMDVPGPRLEAVLAPGATLRQFARVPLVAAFCAWVAEIAEVAATRSGLFEQVVQRFLARAWKGQDDAVVGSYPTGDGARQRRFGAALSELAWVMAVEGDWTDTAAVDWCEEVLGRRGLTGMPGRSLVFEAVRGCGILTQAGVVRGAALGDGPLSWIHRSVQEYLAAVHLLGAPDDSLSEFVRQAWARPADAGVLDFALGTHDARVHDVTARFAGDDDPLAFYTSLLAATSADGADRARVVEAFGRGLLSPLALVAISASADDRERSALLEPVRAGIGGSAPLDSESYRALARCGSAGVAHVADLVAHGDGHAAAAGELFDVDPERAVRAVQARAEAGLSLAGVSARCLRAVSSRTADLVVAAVQEDPGDIAAARVLGYTGLPHALALLTGLYDHPDARVRHSAAAGVLAWHGNALTSPGFAWLMHVALEDPNPEVRVATRQSLYTVGLSLPWVRRALDDQFDGLNREPDSPRDPQRSTHERSLPRTLDQLASALWPVGSATHLVVVMLSQDPRLRTPAMDEPLRQLEQRALAGGLDVTLTADLMRLQGSALTDAALAVLIPPVRLDTTDRDNLATGLALARADDVDVYATLLDVYAEAPTLLLEAALGTVAIAPVERLDLVLLAELALDSVTPRTVAAVRAWTPLARRLILECTQKQREAVRDRVGAATRHLLSLPQR